MEDQTFSMLQDESSQSLQNFQNNNNDQTYMQNESVDNEEIQKKLSSNRYNNESDDFCTLGSSDSNS